MKKTLLMISITSSLILSSCATICIIEPITTKVDNKDIVFATSKIPCYKKDDFNKSVMLAVKAIFSKEFETQLSDHIKNGIGIGEHAKAWENLNATEIVQNMRNQLNGTFVETYGGIKGLWLNKIYGNLAYDGTLNGPILINRIPLKNRSIESISNTIAHEIAHRVGLKHPHSDTDLKIAYKEPPYVIGDIIESIAKELLTKQTTN